ncbi:hypothetical protein [Actinoplanes sp. NPDC049681]|uniref:hypothetical protein n=1 Tax=Actinoplanes sp. NPDC049681 TaxID=3363905 RepID=UPI00379DEC4A
MRGLLSWQKTWQSAVGAAAAASILAAGALAFTTHRPAPEPAPIPAIVPAGPAGLIVRDGDLVEASGPVEAARLCSPAPVPAVDRPCQFGIRAPGIKPTHGATLRGRWHPNRLSDIERLPYAPPSAGVMGPGPYLPDAPPCPAPAGGWSVSEAWLTSGLDQPVDDYLRAHPDQFAEPFATHSGNARILVAEVVRGDVAQARKALTAIYSENLCVIAAPGKHSIADDAELQATTGAALSALTDDSIYTATPEDGKIRVAMVQLTQPLYDKLAAIGLDHLILDPWIRPVRP